MDECECVEIPISVLKIWHTDLGYALDGASVANRYLALDADVAIRRDSDMALAHINGIRLWIADYLDYSGDENFDDAESGEW